MISLGLLEQAGTDSYVLKGCNCKIVFRLDSSFFHQGFQSLRRDGHDRNECRWFWTKKSEPGVQGPTGFHDIIPEEHLLEEIFQ